MTEDSESENKSIPIRASLVDTAVNFLLDPNVKSKPEHGKVAFLKNKGLTDSEIDAAFAKVQSAPRSSITTHQNDLQYSYNQQTKPYYPKSYSFWSNLSSFSSSFIVIAVALYGLHRFYKLYIQPWLFGTKPEKEELKELVKELSDAVVVTMNKVASLEDIIHSQKEQIDRVFLAEGSAYMPIPMAVAELKTEIGNVKSLLINRHQFPAVPKVVNTPSIPHWQLSEEKDSKIEEDLEADPPPSEKDGSDKKETKPKDAPNGETADFDSVESVLMVGNGVHDDSHSTTEMENGDRVL